MSRKYKFNDPEGLYFVSFAVVNWIDVFTRKYYKDILIKSLKYCQQNKGLQIYAWVIMSNHVHLIIQAKDNSLSNILMDFKKHTSLQLREAIQNNEHESRKEWMLHQFASAGANNSNNDKYQFWQQDNHPIILDKPSIMHQKLNYLHNNPVVEGWVENPEDYLYSSAGDYYEKRKGLLQIHMIDPQVITY